MRATTLADACVKNFGENFVAAWDGDRVVCFELDGATEAADEGDGLCGGDGEGAHFHCWG